MQGKILDLSGNYSRRRRQALGNKHHFVPKATLTIGERVDGSSHFLCPDLKIEGSRHSKINID